MISIDELRTTAGDPGGGPRPSPVAVLAGWMDRLGRWRVWVPAAAVFVVFAGVFFASRAAFSIPTVEDACGRAPLDVRPFSTGADVTAFLEGCGPAGRAAYRNLQLADLAYPLFFGLFLASSLAVVLRHLVPRRPTVVALAAVPLVGAGFDYLENVFAWRALAAFPEATGTDALLGLASAAKTATFWAASALLLVATGALVIGRIRRGIGRPSASRARATVGRVPPPSRRHRSRTVG